jgi:glycosyltransferase involved in cell wall biosynthesis
VPVTMGRADDATDAYAAADLIVFPSTWEGFGNPIIESIAHRRACAAYPYPVLAEIRAAGVRVFSTEQPEQLVKFLAEPDATRERYFDANLHRAALSFALAELPQAIDEAFAAHGWLAW